MGQGWSDSVSDAAYGSFTRAGFYLDALAGYAYFNNQLQRQILIPGLQQRTATGSTGANQFLGQIEGGYKVGLYAPAAATITPFGRFQISSVTQNAFSESGAQSLSLNVAQQTTNSLRTTIGADFGSSIGLGNERKLDLAVRLGWQHEFADGRPITAAFAARPPHSPCSARRPRGTLPSSVSRPPPPSPRRLRSTCATTAASAAAPTTTR
jgi:outer membrane autotransporter protein